LKPAAEVIPGAATEHEVATIERIEEFSPARRGVDNKQGQGNLRRVAQIWQRCLLRPAGQRMYVLRHDDLPTNDEIIPPAQNFHRSLEKTARRGRAEIPEPTITTEGEEVKATGLLITNKPLRHPNILHPAGLSGKRRTAHRGSRSPREIIN